MDRGRAQVAARDGRTAASPRVTPAPSPRRSTRGIGRGVGRRPVRCGPGAQPGSPTPQVRSPRRYVNAMRIVIVMNTSDAVFEMIIAQFEIDTPYANHTMKPPASIDR